MNTEPNHQDDATDYWTGPSWDGARPPQFEAEFERGLPLATADETATIFQRTFEVFRSIDETCDLRNLRPFEDRNT